MSKLYFVRHGESEWNVADKILRKNRYSAHEERS